jgi:FkbM family methyltransferase
MPAAGVHDRTVAALLRRGARRLGVEVQLERAYVALLRGLQGPTVRRDRRDNELARVLAAAVLTTHSNCVDIGANEGLLLEIFTELAPQGTHIAYEPIPSLRASLAQRFPQVDVRGAAVSDRCGESTFVVHKRLPSRSSLRPVGYPDADTMQIRVPVEALDRALPAGFVPHLLKVDVEGAEHLVLKGARETLRKHRPVVLFEHQKRTALHYRSGPEEVFRILVDDAGMRIFDLEGEGPYSLAQLHDTYESGRRWNFFAVSAG